MHRTTIIHEKPQIDSNVILYHYSGRDSPRGNASFCLFILFFTISIAPGPKDSALSTVCVYSLKQLTVFSGTYPPGRMPST